MPVVELDSAPVDLEQIKALALTNYGHFTSMLVSGGCVRGLSLHMERLSRDCRALFGHNLDIGRVKHHIRHALNGDSSPVVVRVSVFDPALDLGTIGQDAEPRVMVTTRPANVNAAPAPLKLQAVAYKRENPQVKHVGLFGALQRRRAAQQEGFDDVLFLNPDGTISEIATSNIGFVDMDGQIVWPRSEMLPGVTMTLINQALDEPIYTKSLTLSDLPTMRAVFATNAATGIRAVTTVDDTVWPVDDTTLGRLRELYADIPGEEL